MDISSELIMDVALNVVAYLASGLLAIVIYSAMRRARTAPSVATTAPVAEGMKATPLAVSNERMEFVKFGDAAAGTAVSESKTSVAGGSRSRSHQRGEIIRVAREMLRAGAPRERIQRVLPISDGELALLSMEQN